MVQRAGPNDIHFSTLIGAAKPSGQEFILQLNEGCSIVSIDLCTTTLIKAIRLHCADKDGKKQVLEAGSGHSPCWTKMSIPAPIIGLQGTSGWYIDSLQFMLNDGSSTLPLGGSGGDVRFNLSIHQRSNIWQGTVVGLWGFADHQGIESLGLVFWSVEKSD
jgi:hypothetical protein